MKNTNLEKKIKTLDAKIANLSLRYIELIRTKIENKIAQKANMQGMLWFGIGVVATYLAYIYFF